MKLSINREKSLPSLNLVSTVVERKQTLPILSNLFFELKKGNLRLIGTDLEVEVSEIIAEVKGDDGSFTSSTEKILNIARMLPEKSDINMKQEKKKVILTSGKTRYTLQTLPADEFPRIEAGDWQERIKISQGDLRKLLQKTSFAMAVQDVRYYLNGVLLQVSAKQLRAIATDGHRLAQSDVKIKLDISETQELIIPRKAIMVINQLLDHDGNDDAEVTLEFSKNHLRITKNKTTLITKLIDGKFPEFKGVLENKADVVLSVDRKEFMDTLNRVAILTDATDRFRGVKLQLEKGTMKITAHNVGQEEAEETMEVDYKGELLENGYNVTYLTDVTQASDSKTIELHIQKSDGVCILKQPDDKQTVWLVMPMRI